MAIKYYVKKPCVVPMVKWEDDEASYLALLELGAKDFISVNSNGSLDIKTLEGRMNCPIGNYIARGVNGEFYSIRADIQEKTYEEVPDSEVIGAG